MARTRYEDEKGLIHVINLSQKKIDVLNNLEPNAAVNSPVLVKVSKSNRSYGIRPRQAIIYREVDLAAPAVGKKVITSKIPLLQKATASAAAWAVDTDVDYDGETWKVRAVMPEDY